MIDLDALEQKLASAPGQDLIAESPIGELLAALVAELRAAREVVETVRAAQLNPLAGPVKGWGSVQRAVAAYDKVVSDA